ncbi:hypothetical protein SEA_PHRAPPUCCINO_200 [Mycobacterium phage Phrappuccino]|uniref:Uncharacterized protein n=1 Tax=Mycobacterium phage Phrappuccino TaxID=2591223 RepID=A0A514DE35_9CAUD|nr:minor tail protein [Mycobacterium phage Phrappuccino]QDH91875.1 hypothetical protein SEA_PHRAPPUCCINO_200 [Mycobacterium phage Phrappuccino]QIQ63341.1 hypothetical protein SEA_SETTECANDELA_225 [Mycobacterium phage Settecandela]
MTQQKYVGREPNSDSSMMSKGYIDQRHAQSAVTPEYVTGAVVAYAAANTLVDEDYVTTADGSRAKKTAVDAADTNYLPLTARGAANGVASLDASLRIPNAQLPSPLVTERLIRTVEAQSVFLTSEQSVSSNSTKALQAAALTIADPGYPYLVVPMATVTGRCPGTPDHSRRVGGPSRGKMTILAQDDTLYGGGVTNNAYGAMPYLVHPTALQGATPTPITGTLTLNLWLALYSGGSFIFGPAAFRFWAMVAPAG